MPQKLHTKNFGIIEFEVTFASGAMHIGKLVKGGYAHLSGLPVQTRDELTACIPPGKHLDEALDWWERRNDPVEDDGRQSLKILSDGSYVFEDGAPVETMSDLIQNLPPGPALDAAVIWWTEKVKAEKADAAKAAAAADTPAGKAAKKVKVKGATSPVEAGEAEITD